MDSLFIVSKFQNGMLHITICQNQFASSGIVTWLDVVNNEQRILLPAYISAKIVGFACCKMNSNLILYSGCYEILLEGAGFTHFYIENIVSITKCLAGFII